MVQVLAWGHQAPGRRHERTFQKLFFNSSSAILFWKCLNIAHQIAWPHLALTNWYYHYNDRNMSLIIAYTFRENWDFVFFIIAQFMMSANGRIRIGLQIVFICFYITPSHYHHCANLSKDIELIKWLSDMFVEFVSKLKHILSVILNTICGAVCFQFTHFPCDRENVYTLLYYHHHIRSMNFYTLFRVRSWNNGMHCMSLYCFEAKFVSPLIIVWYMTYNT